MGLSVPRQSFGIYSFTPYSRANGTFYGICKVLASSAVDISGQVIEVYGGANQFSWAAEAGQIKANVTLKPKEFPDFMWTLFFGIAPTTTLTTDSTGVLSAISNILNSSCFSATTGVASVQVASSDNEQVPFGKYLIVVTSTTTVNVYCSTDIDFSVKGQGVAFQNDALKLLVSNITITASTAVAIGGTGLTLTGGSGTIGMTTGDTAAFTAQPPSSRQMNVIVGASGNVTPEFGAIIMSQRRGTGEMFEIDAYRMRAVGFPIGMDEFKWAESNVKATMLYDSVKNGVMGIRYVEEI